MQIRCCVCGKVRQGSQWRKAGQPPKDEQVSHGYCPKCASEAFTALKKGTPLPAASA